MIRHLPREYLNERDRHGKLKVKRLNSSQRYPKKDIPLTAEEIVATRKKLGLRQWQFAYRLAVTVAAVMKWEHGKESPQGGSRILIVTARDRPELFLQVTEPFI